MGEVVNSDAERQGTDPQGASRPTLYIVEDDRIAREALRWLAESVDMDAETFPSAPDFLRSYDKARPGCLVVDVRLPGTSGIELLESLSAEGVELPAIVISGFGDVPTAARAFKAGAYDFIEKPFNERTFLDAVQRCVERDIARRRGVAERSERQARFATLTRREREVLAMVIAGKSSKAIANELAVRPKTVEFHRHNILRKVEAGSLAELVRLAVEAGLGGPRQQRDAAPKPR